MLSTKLSVVPISNPLGVYPAGSYSPKDIPRLSQSHRGAHPEEGVARLTPYLSPPMSGSSPRPSEAASEAGSRSYSPQSLAGAISTGGQHAYDRGFIHQQRIDISGQVPARESMLGRAVGSEQGRTAIPFPQRHSYDSLPRLTSFSQSEPEMMAGGGSPQSAARDPYLSPTGPSSNQSPPYSLPGRQSSIENQPFGTSRSHRKVKGHVASACVPCKRAHLRCDAQRPCSRCLGNGKADSCIDVQHKKRGRPRLRDDRDARYEPVRYGSPQDMGIRRPITLYPSASSSSGNEAMARHGGRVSPRNSYGYGPPTPVTSNRSYEPVAYLTMDLVFASTSPAFLDAIGRGDIRGRNLADVVAPVDVDRTRSIQKYVAEEQKSQEPNYLPPILGRGDQILQALTFSAEEVAQFRLDCQEYLTFVRHDGHPQHATIRFGLAKQESYYFVVILLCQAPRAPYSWPTSHAHAREPAPGYPPPPPATHTSYRPPSQGLSSFDHVRPRFSEGSIPGRQLPDPATQRPNHSPAMSPGPSPFGMPTSRAEILRPMGYDLSRSDTTPTVRPGSGPERQPSFQLPPIRAQPDATRPIGDPGWLRSERSGRLDIGGLLEKHRTPQ